MKWSHNVVTMSRQIDGEWGWMSFLKHRNDEAADRIREVLALDPNYAQGHFRLGLVQIQQRRYPEAIASFKRALDLGAFYPQAASALGFAYGVSGNRAAALNVLADLQRRSARELVPPATIAIVYAGMGDAPRGIEWLNRGIDEKDLYIPENFVDLVHDPLRRDPRFAQVVARMCLK